MPSARRSKWERLAVMALPLSLACSKARPISAGSDVCSHCHSSPESSLPFVATRGVIDPTARGAGAHSAHLGLGTMRGALSCGDCHVVPGKPSEHDYGTGHAEVRFGALASRRGLQPSWDPAAARCSATWCHGGGFQNATATSPEWTDARTLQCDSCHGAPPSPPHPQRTDCNACHAGTVKPDGTIDVEGGLHIDGVVQAPSAGCTTCHGDASRPKFSAAPPAGTRGEKDTSAIAVGAHQSHLLAGKLRSSIACGECHTVPTDLSHIDGTAAVTFGELARSGEARPVWDRATASCSASYCHGATLTGGTNTKPQWTRVDGTQAACGSCHGAPPPAPHPENANCNSCHPATVNSDGSLNVNGGLHINGVIDVTGLSCTSCHGTGIDPAPPAGTHGETATTARAVGAHQSHLKAGPFAGALACGECHLVPTSTGHSDGTVKLTFGAIATAGGATPQWNGSSCSSTYCHGTFSGGIATNAPQWTRVDSTQAACGTCHAQQPGSGHHSTHRSEGISCARCHAGYTTTAVNASLHVNGKKDLDPATGWNATSRSCANSCHGSESW